MNNTEYDGGFRLPFNPLTGVALCDQLDAAYAEAEAAHGPDLAAWPLSLVARLNRQSLRLQFMGQANEEAALRERDRLDRRDGWDVPPWPGEPPI